MPVAAATPVASAPAPASGPSPAAPGCKPLAIELPDLIKTDIDVPVPPLVDESGGGQMAPFYEKLARLARGRAQRPVRIAMYGDSNLTRDTISGELRRTLQRAFGDAGHGWIAVVKPWPWYIHTDIRHYDDAKGWRPLDMSTDQIIDRRYGFAGLAAQPRYGHARAVIETAAAGAPVGTRASRIEVWYLQHPGWGAFDVRLDDQPEVVVQTAGDRIEAARKRFDVADGPHQLEIRSKDLDVRLLGAVFERDKPGVVVDSLGIGGVNVELIARGDRALAVQSLKLRHPDLVMLLTGATEPDNPGHVAAEKEVIDFHRQALPDAPFILMSPPDLAGGTIDRPNKSIRINRIDRQKREVAKAEKTMFWDFRGAMGGKLSIVRFAARKMAWKDFIHLTESGGRYMGRRLGYALMRDFQAYLATHPEAGCDSDAGPARKHASRDASPAAPDRQSPQ